MSSEKMQLCVILSGFCESNFYSFSQFKLESSSLIFSSSVHLSAVVWAGAVKQDTGVRSVTVGENVTLQCFYEKIIAMHLSWYQQTLGGRPELLSFFYKYDDPSKVDHWLKKNPRFSLQKEDGFNHLHISDVQLSDSATYFCGSSHTNMVEFGDGVFLSVKEYTLSSVLLLYAARLSSQFEVQSDVLNSGRVLILRETTELCYFNEHVKEEKRKGTHLTVSGDL
ncbi:Ig kappa chain V-I region Walker [Oryzias melastigma]|uniref:Ig kappa chain V-I region Walker n=1 Tax=Oryzias melastigma TaxID=30732 RepID=A0A834CVL8_ORYME|nr:Ig kappa chain V-I region Walker [Oryzias melastigma]